MEFELFHPAKSKTFGPFTEDDVVHQIKNGLNRDTMIRAMGESEWRSLRTHAPFAMALQRFQGDLGGHVPAAVAPAPAPAAAPPTKKPRRWGKLLLLVLGLIAVLALWVTVGTEHIMSLFGGFLLFALGIGLAKRPRLRNELAAGALMGGGGFNALQIIYFLPILFVLAGMYLMARPLFVAAGYDPNNPMTDCGDVNRVPRNKKIIGDWKDYKCTSQQQAGARWKLCLARVDYSDAQGRGCDGDELCCPPASAITAASTAAARASAAPSASSLAFDRIGTPNLLDFASEILRVRRAYAAAAGEVQRAEAVREFAAVQEKFVGKGVKDWRGELLDVKASPDGSKFFIELGLRVIVEDGAPVELRWQTEDDALLEARGTMITVGTQLYAVLKTLKVHDQVIFSATFERTPIDNTIINFGQPGVTDSTLAGLSLPSYLVKITKLAKAK
jgi:hypothetical protein